MFLLLLFAVPVLEVLAFVGVALAIGWLWALALLITTSVVGVGIARREGRAAIAELVRAVLERRPPGVAALDGALGAIGGMLLAVPGFLTDALGVLLLLPPARNLARRRIASHYGAGAARYVAGSARFGGAGPRRSAPADVDSTAIDEDVEQLPG
jgi:UPF0716 protein FxsA